MISIEKLWGIVLMKISDYNRIIIIGNNGSGKSFLSKEIAIITGLPLFHLDVLFWRPNWEKPSKEEWIKKQLELTSAEKWIIDGNHSDTMELRYQSADLIILLDINRLICLYSVFIRNTKKRSDMPSYLKERFNREYFHFLKGVWNYSKTRKLSIMDLHRKYPDKPLLVIDSRRKMNTLLKEWRITAL